MVKKKSKKVLGEFLFWLHTVVILVMMVAGLFLSWLWVLVILIVQRAQLFVFHGCIITRLEEKEGGIKKGTAYIQLAAKRFFGVRLSKLGVHIVSYSIVAVSLVITYLASRAHFRIHF